MKEKFVKGLSGMSDHHSESERSSGTGSFVLDMSSNAESVLLFPITGKEYGDRDMI